MKRLLLTSLLFLSLAIFLQPVHADDVVSFNVKIVNDSGYDDGDVFLYITGQNPDETNVPNIWNFSTNTFEDISSSTVIDSTTQYNLTEAPQYDAASHSAILTLPREKSARIYFALDNSNAVTKGFASISTFKPSVNAQPDFHSDITLVFDKVEFDAQHTTSINMNTTNVDFFSIPMTFSATDVNTQDTVTYGFNAPRETFFHEFLNIPSSSYATSNNDIFKKLIITNGDSFVRIIAPDKVGDTSVGWGTDKTYFDNFWNNYVDGSWVAGRKIDIYDNDNVLWTAKIGKDGSLTASSPDGSTETHAKPVADADDSLGHIIFGGVGATFGGKVGPILNSAIQRGVMHLPGEMWKTEANFYQGHNTAMSPVNYYGKILHKYSLSNKCYALPYDDNYNWDPAIYIENGDTFTVTIGKMVNNDKKASFQMNVSPDGYGTTTPAVGTDSEGIFSGTPYMITAIPQEGYDFKSWSSDPDAVIEDSTKASTYVTIKEGDTTPTITANFIAESPSCINVEAFDKVFQLHYCAEYNGQQYEFNLTSPDLNIWTLDPKSFKMVSGQTGCIPITDDLFLTLPCVQLSGQQIDISCGLSYNSGNNSWETVCAGR